MKDIYNIYKITYNQRAEFRGTLRNERMFEYGQKIFVGLGQGESISVYPAIIKGIEDDEDLSNPSYIYKVQLPDWAVKAQETIYEKASIDAINKIEWYKFLARYRVYKYNKGALKVDKPKYLNVRCDKIFTSIQQAKDAVLDNYNNIAELERKNIDRYFERFNNQ